MKLRRLLKIVTVSKCPNREMHEKINQRAQAKKTGEA